MISVIIPTLNEARVIGSTLAHLANANGQFQIIVVDGGSTDGTAEICRGFSTVHFIQMASAQRARQMNCGADGAMGNILLFLHADTIPPPDFVIQIGDALSRNDVIGGAFSITFDANHWLLKVISHVTRLNLAWLTFGDHGIFLRKADFMALDGFSEMPILEDLDFQVRMRKQGTVARPRASVRTSARRFINNGVIRQTFKDVAILVGYFIGVPAVKLAQYYCNTDDRAR